MTKWGGSWDRPSTILKPIKTVIDAISLLLNDAQERVTKGIANINTDHKYIHRGIAYKSFIRLDDFGEETNLIYVLKTPSDKDLHFKNIKAQAKGGSVLITVKRSTIENPIVFTETEGVPDTGTTTIPELTGPNNLNDAYGAPPETIITKTPTFDTNQSGEDWFYIQVLGDTTNQYVSVDTSSDSVNEEAVMDNAKYYILELAKLDGEPSYIMLTTFWYEEPEMNNE